MVQGTKTKNNKANVDLSCMATTAGWLTKKTKKKLGQKNKAPLLLKKRIVEKPPS